MSEGEQKEEGPKSPPPPPERYAHIRKVLERVGPFTHEDFEPSPEVLKASTV